MRLSYIVAIHFSSGVVVLISRRSFLVSNARRMGAGMSAAMNQKNLREQETKPAGAPAANRQRSASGVSGSRARRIVANAGISVLSVALALLALEIGLRLFSGQQAPLLVRDAIVGQRYQAGLSGRRFIPEAGREVELRFNRLGFRGPDRPFAKPPGVRRIAVLGDSFVAAVQVDEADTMVAQLERRLNAPGAASRWEAMNFGIGGFSTAQSLLTWRHFARQFHPDIVLLCFYNGNDLWDNDRALTSYPRPYFRLDAAGNLHEIPLSPLQVSGTRWLNEHSRLYVWQREKIAILRGLFRSAVDRAPSVAPIFDSDPPPLYTDAWRLTEKLVATLADEVRSSGAQIVLVDIAEQDEFVDDYWRKVVDTAAPTVKLDRGYPEKRLGRVATRGHFPFIPLVDAFRAAPHPEQLHFHWQGHWNEAGNHLAAATIFARLKEMGLVQ